MAADTGRDQIAFELVEALAQYLSERRHYDEKLEIAAVGLNWVTGAARAKCSRLKAVRGHT
jgi:hypothetical protein